MIIAIGTANFNKNYGVNNRKEKLDNIEIKKILKYAVIKKINYIDTALSYDNSHIIQNFFEQNKTNNLKIINKVDDSNLNNIYSMSNLILNKTEYILIHNYNDLRNKNFIKELTEFTKKYNIKLGISIYNDFNFFELINYDFDLIQMPFNLFDKENLNKITKIKRFKPKIEIQIRSIFLQGLLEKDINYLCNRFNINYEIKKILMEIKKKYNITLGELSLLWVKNILPNLILTFGVNNLSHFRNNLNLLRNYKIENQDINKLLSINYNICKNRLDPRKW